MDVSQLKSFTELSTVLIMLSMFIDDMYNHRLMLLKLEKQIGGTTYRSFLAANEAQGLEGVECSTYALLGAEFHH